MATTPDRKSTRLNSSHIPISYAVFCLKKKNTAPDLNAEAALKTFFDLSREMLSIAFFRGSRDMLCIAVLDGVTTCINRAWEATLGYTTEELLAMPYVDFVHPED